MILKAKNGPSDILWPLSAWEVIELVTDPRKVAQALARLTIRNVPKSNVGRVNVQSKVVPFHATKKRRGSTGTASLILNLSGRCRWVVNFTPRPPYPINYSDKLFYDFIQTLGKCRDITSRPLPFRSLNSWNGIETRLRNGRSGVRIPTGAKFYLSSKTSRLALGPTQLFPRRVKWSQCESDHSPPSSVEVKNEWSYTSTDPIDVYGVYKDVTFCVLLIISQQRPNYPSYNQEAQCRTVSRQDNLQTNRQNILLTGSQQQTVPDSQYQVASLALTWAARRITEISYWWFRLFFA
jgi:hypothetical protein